MTTTHFTGSDAIVEANKDLKVIKDLNWKEELYGDHDD